MCERLRSVKALTRLTRRGLELCPGWIADRPRQRILLLLLYLFRRLFLLGTEEGLFVRGEIPRVVLPKLLDRHGKLHRGKLQLLSNNGPHVGR